jgi:hypothetical protein
MCYKRLEAPLAVSPHQPRNHFGALHGAHKTPACVEARLLWIHTLSCCKSCPVGQWAAAAVHVRNAQPFLCRLPHTPQAPPPPPACVTTCWPTAGKQTSPSWSQRRAQLRSPGGHLLTRSLVPGPCSYLVGADHVERVQPPQAVAARGCEAVSLFHWASFLRHTTPQHVAAGVAVGAWAQRAQTGMPNKQGWDVARRRGYMCHTTRTWHSCQQLQTLVHWKPVAAVPTQLEAHTAEPRHTTCVMCNVSTPAMAPALDTW